MNYISQGHTFPCEECSAKNINAQFILREFVILYLLQIFIRDVIGKVIQP
jgi:hypothetical protein